MNYTQEMNLQSKSGYCMPFEERKGEVRMSLDYGTQVHPKSGDRVFPSRNRLYHQALSAVSLCGWNRQRYRK